MKLVSKKKHIPIVNDNLFSHVERYVNDNAYGSSIIVPHVCNNINAFGAGFAAAISQHYPIVKENYHMLGTSFLQTHMGYTQFVDVYKNKQSGHRLIFANMIAQNGILHSTNPRPLNYHALVRSMTMVSNYIHNNFDKNDNQIQIHAPKFGCGLAGGNWDFIQELIRDVWHNIPIYIYSYNNK